MSMSIGSPPIIYWASLASLLIGAFGVHFITPGMLNPKPGRHWLILLMSILVGTPPIICTSSATLASLLIGAFAVHFLAPLVLNPMPSGHWLRFFIISFGIGTPPIIGASSAPPC